ncbi:hypothetical protein [Herbidospora solisilvae]|nr:hypothetical protein [Herbidospora solisilvae]
MVGLPWELILGQTCFGDEVLYKVKAARLRRAARWAVVCTAAFTC